MNSNAALTHKSVSAGLEAAVFVSMGLVCAFYVLWLAVDVWKVRQSLDWTRVEGRVVAVQVRDGGRKVGHCLDLAYTYDFEGGHFSGRNRSFGTAPCGPQARVEELARAYVPGAPIDVYVKPKDIFESVLHPGVMEGGTWTSIGVFGLFAVACGWLAVVTLRDEQRA